MANALFITEQFLKDSTPIDENVDMRLLTNLIEEAQDMHIQPILGSTLYGVIQGEIDAGSVSSINQTLLNNYVQPALKMWCLYEGVDVLSFKFTNKNIVQKNSENSTPVGVSELKRIMDRYKNKAEWYTQRLVDYLIENAESYSTYQNPGSGVDVIHPEKKTYDTGIFLDTNYKGSIIDRYENGDCEGC